MSAHGLALLPIIALVLFSLYRRYRSHVGPQLVTPRRMMLRVVLFGVAAVFILAAPMSLQLRLEMAAGMAAGAALGLLSLHHTRFETREAKHYYIPNIYIGLAVSALFMVRIAYRFMVLYPQMQQAGGVAAMAGAGGPLAAFGGSKSALTLILLGVVIGYYTLYYAGVMMLSRRAVAAQPAVGAGTDAGADRTG